VGGALGKRFLLGYLLGQSVQICLVTQSSAVHSCVCDICSDAGGYDTWIHKHATALVEAVKRTIGNDPLTYVLCETPSVPLSGLCPLY